MDNIEKFEMAKRIITENFKDGECGIYNCSNLFGDPMATLYDKDNLTILICYNYSYFEVFGLSDADFSELKKFYQYLRENSKENEYL